MSSSKYLSLDSPVVSVKTLVLELESDARSFVTLRVKQDRRQTHRDVPAAVERRGAARSSYTKKPASI